MSKRINVAAEPFVRARKRSNSAGAVAEAAPLNPLLAILPKIEADAESFEYKNHREWDAMQSAQGCKIIFKKWYDKFGSAYKHERHAFNHFCKHYGGVSISRINVFANDAECTVFWKFDVRDLPTRVYQIIDSSEQLVASIEGGEARFEKSELEPLKKLIEKLCA